MSVATVGGIKNATVIACIIIGHEGDDISCVWGDAGSDMNNTWHCICYRITRICHTTIRNSLVSYTILLPEYLPHLPDLQILYWKSAKKHPIKAVEKMVCTISFDLLKMIRALKSQRNLSWGSLKWLETPQGGSLNWFLAAVIFFPLLEFQLLYTNSQIWKQEIT